MGLHQHAKLMTFISLLAVVVLRQALAVNQAYFILGENKLGKRDYKVANGNPMKGLIANPEFWYDPSIDSIDSSMDIYYVPVGKVMLDDPNVVGFESAFNWTYVEDRLKASGETGRHVVLTFAVHYPGQPLSLPGHLERSNEVPLHWYAEFMGGGLTPDYGNEALMRALVDFVHALGRKYDGDNRVAFIHLGLLGFWGEWHTFPLLGLVPDSSKERIVDAFRASFAVTKLQARYPDSRLDGFGYYDGSFAYNTLDGDANGGVINKDWYFWPLVQKEGHSAFWKTAPMGGETRPELQHYIFEDSYPRRTFEHQDFEESVAVTHATYMLHPNAFIEGGYNGTELENALRGHGFLGYNFIVNKVSVFDDDSRPRVVDVEVTIEQIGVAPFYYPLAVTLDCPALPSKRQFGGLERLVDKGSFLTRKFRDIPATVQCLGAISIALDSPMLLPGRRMKFSQGEGFITVSLPVPSDPITDPLDDDSEETVVSVPDEPVADGEELGTTNVTEDILRIDIYYLASRSNEVDEWVALSSGDVVVAPEFGLSLEARPSEPISSIWFAYGATNMKIENVPPYSLEGIDYLNSSGRKDVVATAFKDGRSVAVMALPFEVIAHSGRKSVRGLDADELSESVNVDSVIDIGFMSANCTAHGFNSPYAPTLLQLEWEERRLKPSFTDRLRDANTDTSNRSLTPSSTTRLTFGGLSTLLLSIQALALLL